MKCWKLESWSVDAFVRNARYGCEYFLILLFPDVHLDIGILVLQNIGAVASTAKNIQGEGKMQYGIRARWWLLVLLFTASWTATAGPKPYQYCYVPGMDMPRQIPTPRENWLQEAYRFPPSRLLRDPTLAPISQCNVSPQNYYDNYGQYCAGFAIREHDANCSEQSFRNRHCAPIGQVSAAAPDDENLLFNGLFSPGDWLERAFTRALRPGSTGQAPQTWRGNSTIEFWSHPIQDDAEIWRITQTTNTTRTHALTGSKKTDIAGAPALCYTMAHLVGFFNGVWNTKREAELSLEEIEKPDFLGPNRRGAPIRYELFYNQSCKRKADESCLQDVAEVFRQRSAEIDGLLGQRWEYFWEQVTGQHAQPGSFTERLVSRVVGSDIALTQWFGTLRNAVLARITALTTGLAANPPTAQDTAAHTAQLIRAGERAERAVLIAHSQGNLFVNAAYDAYLAHARQVGARLGEDTRYVAAQVVHVAPASPTLRGPYVLADSDLVINGLRRADGTYLPASNVSLAFDSKDPSGHKLLDTYLDNTRPVRAQIRQLVTDARDAL